MDENGWDKRKFGLHTNGNHWNKEKFVLYCIKKVEEKCNQYLIGMFLEKLKWILECILRSGKDLGRDTELTLELVVGVKFFMNYRY